MWGTYRGVCPQERSKEYVSNVIVIGLFVLGLLMGVTTGVVVYKMLKQNNDCTDYTKLRGVCLDLVVVTILLYTIVTGCIKKR